MKIKLINKKQITMIVLSLLLVLGAYLGFSYSGIDVSNQIADVENYSESFGDVQLVSSQNVYEVGEKNEDDAESSNDENNNEAEGSENSIEESEVLNQETTDDYFEESKMERDKMYSETLEVYENILSNDSISSEQKLIAENEITAITNTKNGILIAENLIKVKGFEDVVIFVNDATASVVVKANELETSEIAQIQNIIMKQLGLDASNISITTRSE